MQAIPPIIKILRPHQYVKNLLIFAPLFFAAQLHEVDLLRDTCFAFFCFCLIASAIYTLNDWIDMEEDRKHPTKRHRPLANGTVSLRSAYILFACLSLTGLALSWQYSVMLGSLMTAYFIINILYTLRLKQIAILDVHIIALGFVIRLFVGSSTTGISLSMWIILLTFLFALFLAFAKRRDDVLIFHQAGERTRKNVEGYNLEFLNAAIVITSSVVIVCYIMYTISTEVLDRIGSQYLYLTTFFVVLGILRYMQITFVENQSGHPTKLLLCDTFLQSVVISWLSVFAYILNS